MKRACIIVTDANMIEWYDPTVLDEDIPPDWLKEPNPVAVAYTDPQLLADLRTLTHPWAANGDQMADARARVRALLPKGDGDE